LRDLRVVEEGCLGEEEDEVVRVEVRFDWVVLVESATMGFESWLIIPGLARSFPLTLDPLTIFLLLFVADMLVVVFIDDVDIPRDSLLLDEESGSTLFNTAKRLMDWKVVDMVVVAVSSSPCSLPSHQHRDVRRHCSSP
jgi:hypothetical protein